MARKLTVKQKHWGTPTCLFMSPQLRIAVDRFVADSGPFEKKTLRGTIERYLMEGLKRDNAWTKDDEVKFVAENKLRAVVAKRGRVPGKATNKKAKAG